MDDYFVYFNNDDNNHFQKVYHCSLCNLYIITIISFLIQCPICFNKNLQPLFIDEFKIFVNENNNIENKYLIKNSSTIREKKYSFRLYQNQK